MMKTNKLICSIILLLLFIPVIMFAKQNSICFLNEQLAYRIKYIRMTAGSMNFNITKIVKIDSIDTYHLTVHAKTKNMFSSMFKVDNYYESYFDTLSLLPLLIQKSITQKNISHRMTIKYDHNNGVASVDDSTVWSIPSPTYGFFSMFYYLRSQKMCIGDTVQFYLDSENLQSNVIVSCAKQEKLSFKDEKISAYQLILSFEAISDNKRPWKTDLLTNRLANPNSKISIWISDDASRLPLIIKFKQQPFDLTMILEDVIYQN